MNESDWSFVIQKEINTVLYINYINLKKKKQVEEMVVTWARLLDKVEVLKRGK